MYDHSGPNQCLLMTKMAVRKTLPLGAAHTYLCSLPSLVVSKVRLTLVTMKSFLRVFLLSPPLLEWNVSPLQD